MFSVARSVPPEARIPPFYRSIKAWNLGIKSEPVAFTSSEPKTESALPTNANPIRDGTVLEMEEVIVIPWPFTLHILNIIELTRHHSAGPWPLP